MSATIQGIIQLILVFLFIGASIAASYILQSTKADSEEKEQEDRALYVSTQNIETGPHRIAFKTTGTVKTRSEIEVVTQISGRIIERNENFSGGGTFKAGETLFKIDPRDFELEVERLDAAVAQARTAFELEEAESAAALSEWKALNPSKKAPTLVARKPQMDEAWANLKAAKAQLENAKLDLERTTFSYPFDGKVLSSAIETGQYIVAGQSFGQVFNLASLEVQVSLEDLQLEWIVDAKNPTIDIVAKYLGQERTYKGVLKRGASALDTETRFASITIGFAPNQNIEKLVPGVFADLYITGSEMQNIATLPASALQKEGIIWIVKDDNTLQSLTPDIVYTTEKAIAIRSTEPTLNVVTSRVAGATNGMRIEITNNSGSGDNSSDKGGAQSNTPETSPKDKSTHGDL